MLYSKAELPKTPTRGFFKPARSAIQEVRAGPRPGIFFPAKITYLHVPRYERLKPTRTCFKLPGQAVQEVGTVIKPVFAMLTDDNQRATYWASAKQISLIPGKQSTPRPRKLAVLAASFLSETWLQAPPEPSHILVQPGCTGCGQDLRHPDRRFWAPLGAGGVALLGPFRPQESFGVGLKT